MVHRHPNSRACLAGTALLTLGTGLYVMLGIDTPIVKLIIFEVIGGLNLSLLLSTPMLAIQNRSARPMSWSRPQARTRSQHLYLPVDCPWRIGLSRQHGRSEIIARRQRPQ